MLATRGCSGAISKGRRGVLIRRGGPTRRAYPALPQPPGSRPHPSCICTARQTRWRPQGLRKSIKKFKEMDSKDIEPVRQKEVLRREFGEKEAVKNSPELPSGGNLFQKKPHPKACGCAWSGLSPSTFLAWLNLPKINLRQHSSPDLKGTQAP